MRIATASVRTGFAMTWFFARGAVGRADVGIGHYGGFTRSAYMRAVGDAAPYEWDGGDGLPQPVCALASQ